MTLLSAAQRIYLVGPRGAGKSTIGRLLADRLGWHFEDCDAAVERASGLAVAQVFRSAGESAFRDAEHTVLARLAGQPRLVIATGGGAVLRPANRALLRSTGVTIYLTASTEELCDRLATDPAPARRPPLTALPQADEVAQVVEHRDPLYRDVASITVDTTGQTPDAVVDAILAAC